MVNALLMEGVANSDVIFGRIEGQGYKGGRTTVKNYIAVWIATPRGTVTC